MTRIAFLGTGLMGSPMAHRLVTAGHDVTVWNRTASKCDPLIRAGAHSATTPADACEGREVVITMVSDPAALDAVAFGPSGFSQSLSPTTVYIDMSTVGPDFVRSIPARFAAGQPFLDAPVLGSVPQAADGSLDIFVGGDRAAFETARPLLAALGNPVHVGPLGAGASLKLVVNAALVSLQCLLGECLSLGDSFGLDQSVVLDALAVSSLGPVVEKKRRNIETGNFSPRFSLDNAIKDSCLIGDAARSRNVELRLAQAARRWYEMAGEAGLGSEDYSAVIKAIRR